MRLGLLTRVLPGNGAASRNRLFTKCSCVGIILVVASLIQWGRKMTSRVATVAFQGIEAVAVDVQAQFLSGQVQFLCNNLPTLGGQLKAGTMRGLLTTTAERLKEYPDIPTARELGMEPLEAVMGWSGLYGPPGLPADVVAKWVDALKRIAQDPDWLRGNAGFGAIPAIRSPADTEKFAREQFEFYEKLGISLGLRK